ncbi:MAG TPA: hypothetical protein PKY05_08750 [Fibrobacteria bacterium]|nr:hypothetical protein [Fibrobacteria bacterium]
MRGIDPDDGQGAPVREDDEVSPYRVERGGRGFPDDPELGDVTEARTRRDLLLGGAMLAGALATTILLFSLETIPFVLVIALAVLVYSGVLRLLRGFGGLLPSRSRDD